MPEIKSGKCGVTTKKYGKNLLFELVSGGPRRTWQQKPLLREGESAKLILRWRRFPLTREVLLKAKDGTEFCLIADVKTPYKNSELDWTIDLSEPGGTVIKRARAINDAEPASPVACLVDVPPVNSDRWREANQ
jgi:hypothetical protein